MNCLFTTLVMLFIHQGRYQQAGNDNCQNGVVKNCITRLVLRRWGLGWRCYWTSRRGREKKKSKVMMLYFLCRPWSSVKNCVAWVSGQNKVTISQAVLWWMLYYMCIVVMEKILVVPSSSEIAKIDKETFHQQKFKSAAGSSTAKVCLQLVT